MRDARTLLRECLREWTPWPGLDALLREWSTPILRLPLLTCAVTMKRESALEDRSCGIGPVPRPLRKDTGVGRFGLHEGSQVAY